MKLSIFVLSVVVVVVLGVPVAHTEPETGPLCATGLFTIPLCCATDVLGIANLDCQAPSSTPDSAKSFRSICSKVGQRARCCVLPVARQALLCTDVVGA